MCHPAGVVEFIICFFYKCVTPMGLWKLYFMIFYKCYTPLGFNIAFIFSTRRSLGRISMLHECLYQNRMLRPEDRREVGPRLCSGYRSDLSRCVFAALGKICNWEAAGNPIVEFHRAETPYGLKGLAPKNESRMTEKLRIIKIKTIKSSPT